MTPKVIQNTRKPIIVVEKVSKFFPLHPQLVKFQGETLLSYAKKLIIPRKRGGFMGLENINFSVYSGEQIGIIGKNGAGKTTLLRILSGINKPTEGKIEVIGQFGELFALNAGFNPELSGRKNIFIYAAMKNIPVKILENKIDEIIDFSELGEFIDIPIKQYSNGMRGRLGFSLVINFLPEIIFIDEALATGDAQFRQKCRSILTSLRDEKRTLVLVSHSSDMVKELCDRVIWLDKGKILMDGPVSDVLNAYMGNGKRKAIK